MRKLFCQPLRLKEQQAGLWALDWEDDDDEDLGACGGCDGGKRTPVVEWVREFWVWVLSESE